MYELIFINNITYHFLDDTTQNTYCSEGKYVKIMCLHSIYQGNKTRNVDRYNR